MSEERAIYIYTIDTLDYWLSWNCVPRCCCCYAGTWYIERAWVHGLHMYTRWWNKKWSAENLMIDFQNSKRSARGVFIKVSSSYILLLYTSRITKKLLSILYSTTISHQSLVVLLDSLAFHRSKWKELENLLRVIKRCTPIYVLYYIPIVLYKYYYLEGLHCHCISMAIIYVYI